MGLPSPPGASPDSGHETASLQFRRCSRPLCSRVADVVLLFEYAASHVALDWSPEAHDPNHLELCLEHAETFSPPQGWSVEDRRLAIADLDEAAHVASLLG